MQFPHEHPYLFATIVVVIFVVIGAFFDNMFKN